MMDKISIGANVFVYPMPVVLVGVNADDKANFMAVGWITRINGSPPMVAIGISKSHYTTGFIKTNKVFSINYPNQELLEKTDYCGIVSGKNEDKSRLFNVFYGSLKAPMINECTLNLECKLHDYIDLPTHALIIGEIIGSYTEEKYMKDGKLDIKLMNPLLLTMPDNNYWVVGENTGRAWHDGLNLKRK